MSERIAEDVAELEAACFELARATKWVQRPIDSAEIETFAKRLAADGQSFVSEPLGIDLRLIARAVRYVTQVHAIPAMGDDTYWFTNTLSVLLEVARPNSGVEGDGRAFLKDMVEGIRSLEEE
jgi:hypothetical protein